MKITSYFIKHPVAAIILNCMLIVVGVMCFKTLSVREYPKIETSTVTVVANYPNASAELVETSVTNILEDKLSGVEGVETIRSWSNPGNAEIRLNFSIGVSIDNAVSDIRDKLSLAKMNLPTEVRDPTIIKSGKAQGDTSFMYLSVESKSMGFGELTHYAELNLKNVLRSINGVADVGVLGQQYMYSIDIDPKKLHKFKINADEIFDQIQRNNTSMPAGKYLEVTPATLNTELKSEKDFENLILRYRNFSNPKEKQHAVFLRDVAEIKLKTDDRTRVRVNGKPGIAMSIDLSSNANPLEVSNLIREELKTLKKSIPEDMNLYVSLDQADFIRTSVNNIYSATIEAILLVLGIVFIFLRNTKSTIVPIVTIPISLVGSILFLKLFGFSINTMTLLAMVLAVGLVVDDAIVVLENISRHREQGKKAIEAAIDGAKEIGFAIIAITMTLVSVYAPFAFIEGAIGKIFMEFAVALAGSVLISGIVALTLSPLMCSVILRKEQRTILPLLDLYFNKIINGYKNSVCKMMENIKISVIIAIVSCVVSGYFFMNLPSETAPKEDRGLIGVMLPPVPLKNIDFYEGQLLKLEKMVGEIPEAKGSIGIAANWGSVLIFPLKLKKDRNKSADMIVKSLYPKVMVFPSQDAWPWSWDSNLPGVSDELSFQDISMVISSTDDYKKIYEVMEKIKKELDKDKMFSNVGHNLNINSLAYKVDINNNALSRVFINNRQIAKTIEIFFSGNRHLNFQKDGILYDILIESSVKPSGLSELYVTNAFGKRVSLSSVCKLRKTTEPGQLFHYNQMKSATIGLDVASGYNFSEAYTKLNKILNEILPKNYKKSPIGAMKSLKDTSNTMTMLFVMAILFIFAILALQFDNFKDPFIVLITIPLACSGALFTMWLFGLSLNIYTQVGLITLVGLITKHGILIIEFVNQLIERGLTLKEAIRDGASLRLRPILMTTGAMIFGLIPLVLSKDSGHESRECIGYVLIGGLCFGTFFTLFVLPTICYLTKRNTVK